MGAIAPALPFISAGASIIGGAGSLIESSRASSAAQRGAQYKAKAAEIQNRASRLATQRQKELDIGTVRGAESQLTTAQSLSGNITTSAYKGSRGSVASQYKSNLGFGNVQQQLQDLYAQYENQAIQAGNEASQYASYTQAFSSLPAIGQGIQQFGKL
jgi:hypothetical protein